jgi:transcriptional regulator with XRE-family HTH domain
MQLCYIESVVYTPPHVVVCASPQDLAQASQFAKKRLENAELRTFEDIVQHIPIQPVLIYLTVNHQSSDHVSPLLKAFKSTAVNVVIYCAYRPAPEQAAGLGQLVGEVRPRYTKLAFGADAAVAALQVTHHTAKSSASGSSPLFVTRERLGLTQTEMARALGVSLRTIQNWERQIGGGRGHLLRDLQELVSILAGVLPNPDVPAWLRSENDSFRGKRPIDLILDGKTRDVIHEFQRLQAGEPV